MPDQTQNGITRIKWEGPNGRASRLFNGSSDWIKLSIVGYTPNFTLGLWIQSGDTSGNDVALISAEAASSGASTNRGLGFYWNKDELIVKYYYIDSGAPTGPGIFEEKSVSFTSPLDTPVFVAVTATTSPLTFRFYAGETPETVVQIGSNQVATAELRTTSNRRVALGARTTGPTATQAADGFYFSGYMNRVGFWDDQTLTLDELRYFSATGSPLTPGALDTIGYPNGYVWEMWGLVPETDSSINFFPTDSITGTTAEAPISPATPWTYITNIGQGRAIDALVQLDDDSILATLRTSNSVDVRIFKSTDNGATWTLKDTLSGQPSIEVLTDLGGGVVIGAGFVGFSAAGLWKSTDYGDNWTFVQNLETTQVVNAFADLGGGTILAATNNAGKIYRSTDYGDTWAHFSTLAENYVSSIIAISAGTLLAGSNTNKVYRSTDSGANWSLLATLTPGTAGGVTMRAMGDGVILAGTGFGDLYYSDDDGATWVRTLNTGDSFLNFFNSQPQAVFITVGACTFAVDRKFLNLWQSSDGGQTWTAILPNPYAVSEHLGLQLLSNGTLLVGGDQGFLGPDGFERDNQGVYTIDLDFFECSPQIRVVNERRIISLSKVLLCEPQPGACCHPVVMTTPRQGRTNSYVATQINDLSERRISAYLDEVADPPGAVNVTRIQKLIEYRETPRDSSGINVGSLATCSLRVKLRIVRVEDLVQVYELEQYASLSYTKRWTELDDFTLKMSADTFQARQMIGLGIVPTNGKFILNVFIEGLPDFAGFIDNVSVDITNRGEHIWTLRGFGVDRILSDRSILPPAGDAYDRYEGPAESIMKALVTRHAVSPITTGIANLSDADRAIAQLVIAVDAGLGSSVKFEGRFQKLHEGLLQISRSSNDIGFGVKLIDSVLIFEVSQGVDRSRQCVLAIELDNLGDFTLDQDGTQFASHVIMGGTGEDTARTLLAVSTEASTRTGIERREAFQDARDLDTTVALNDKGVAFLQERGLIVTMGGNKLTGTRPCYRRDFQVGDFITMRNQIYNLSQVTRVMEARLTVQGGKLEQVDLVFAKPRKDPIKFMQSSPPITASSRV